MNNAVKRLENLSQLALHIVRFLLADGEIPEVKLLAWVRVDAPELVLVAKSEMQTIKTPL